MVCDGSTFSFWDNTWCSDRAVKNTFPTIYMIESRLEASVAELLEILGGSIKWNVRFLRAGHMIGKLG